MGVIYLEHPRHGQKVATTDVEAKHDKENGWVEFEPETHVEPKLPAFLGGVDESDIPAEFPGREALIKGGLTTWASLQGKTAEEFTALSGIGNATAKAILDKLNS